MQSNSFYLILFKKHEFYNPLILQQTGPYILNSCLNGTHSRSSQLSEPYQLEVYNLTKQEY